MIFVTVGTHEQPFNRLIQKVDELKRDGVIKDLTLFIVLTLNYYLNIERKNDLKKFWIIAFVLNIFVYRYSASRTGFIVISIFELLILTQKIGIARKKLTKLPVVVFCMLMGFTYMTPFLKNLGMLDITTLFNGRVSYTYLYLTKYGYSLFGFNNSLSETGLLLDNGYLRLLIETGVVGLLIWIYLNVNTVHSGVAGGKWSGSRKRPSV